MDDSYDEYDTDFHLDDAREHRPASVASRTVTTVGNDEMDCVYEEDFEDPASRASSTVTATRRRSFQQSVTISSTEPPEVLLSRSSDHQYDEDVFEDEDSNQLKRAVNMDRKVLLTGEDQGGDVFDPVLAPHDEQPDANSLVRDAISPGVVVVGQIINDSTVVQLQSVIDSCFSYLYAAAVAAVYTRVHLCIEHARAVKPDTSADTEVATECYDEEFEEDGRMEEHSAGDVDGECLSVVSELQQQDEFVDTGVAEDPYFDTEFVDEEEIGQDQYVDAEIIDEDEVGLDSYVDAEIVDEEEIGQDQYVDAEIIDEDEAGLEPYVSAKIVDEGKVGHEPSVDPDIVDEEELGQEPSPVALVEREDDSMDEILEDDNEPSVRSSDQKSESHVCDSIAVDECIFSDVLIESKREEYEEDYEADGFESQADEVQETQTGKNMVLLMQIGSQLDGDKNLGVYAGRVSQKDDSVMSSNANAGIANTQECIDVSKKCTQMNPTTGHATTDSPASSLTTTTSSISFGLYVDLLVNILLQSALQQSKIALTSRIRRAGIDNTGPINETAGISNEIALGLRAHSNRESENSVAHSVAATPVIVVETAVVKDADICRQDLDLLKDPASSSSDAPVTIAMNDTDSKSVETKENNHDSSHRNATAIALGQKLAALTLKSVHWSVINRHVNKSLLPCLPQDHRDQRSGSIPANQTVGLLADEPMQAANAEVTSPIEGNLSIPSNTDKHSDQREGGLLDRRLQEIELRQDEIMRMLLQIVSSGHSISDRSVSAALVQDEMGSVRVCSPLIHSEGCSFADCTSDCEDEDVRDPPSEVANALQRRELSPENGMFRVHSPRFTETFVSSVLEIACSILNSGRHLAAEDSETVGASGENSQTDESCGDPSGKSLQLLHVAAENLAFNSTEARDLDWGSRDCSVDETGQIPRKSVVADAATAFISAILAGLKPNDHHEAPLEEEYRQELVELVEISEDARISVQSLCSPDNSSYNIPREDCRLDTAAMLSPVRDSIPTNSDNVVAEDQDHVENHNGSQSAASSTTSSILQLKQKLRLSGIGTSASDEIGDESYIVTPRRRFSSLRCVKLPAISGPAPTLVNHSGVVESDISLAEERFWNLDADVVNENQVTLSNTDFADGLHESHRTNQDFSERYADLRGNMEPKDGRSRLRNGELIFPESNEQGSTVMTANFSSSRLTEDGYTQIFFPDSPVSPARKPPAEISAAGVHISRRLADYYEYLASRAASRNRTSARSAFSSSPSLATPPKLRPETDSVPVPTVAALLPDRTSSDPGFTQAGRTGTNRHQLLLRALVSGNHPSDNTVATADHFPEATVTAPTQAPAPAQALETVDYETRYGKLVAFDSEGRSGFAAEEFLDKLSRLIDQRIDCAVSNLAVSTNNNANPISGKNGKQPSVVASKPTRRRKPSAPVPAPVLSASPLMTSPGRRWTTRPAVSKTN
jgi:hypothetical protein